MDANEERRNHSVHPFAFIRVNSRISFFPSPPFADEKENAGPRRGSRSCVDSERSREAPDYFLGPRIASLAALATRNLTTFLAGMWIGSPVAGLRPMRALRFTRTSLPMPGMVK